MKLLQTLCEAAEKKAKVTAADITGDAAKVSALTKKAIAHLKSTFKKELADTPMAVITQHVRSAVDGALVDQGTRLNGAGLASVVSAVLTQLKATAKESGLFEADEMADDEEITEAKADPLGAWIVHKNGKQVKKYKTREAAKKFLESNPGYTMNSAEAFADGKYKTESMTESKMAELDLDFDELSPAEFKKKYECTKKEMRAKATSGNKPAAKKTVKEGLSSVDSVMLDILADNISIEDVMVRPSTPAQRQAAKVLQRMYDDYAGESGLHGDDDFEKILLNVYEQLEERYGHLANNDEDFDDYPDQGREDDAEARRYESVNEAKKAEADDGDEDDKKVSTKSLAKSMEDDGEDDEDADIKKADKASKDAPKKIADTSVKPEELKSANAKLPKQIAASLDSYDVKSAFELTKKLRVDFPKITPEQLKQASTIWKAENN